MSNPGAPGALPAAGPWGRRFGLLCLFQLVAWTLIPLLFHPNVSLDVVEIVAWGHQWQFGYFKHPPLPSWLAEAIANLSDARFAAKGVAALVEAAGRSPEHVARTCRAVYGKSPTDLVTEARLGHAALLLAGGDASIVKIAADCGFETLSHFYACFGARFGVPPASWRRRQHRIVRPGRSRP